MRLREGVARFQEAVTSAGSICHAACPAARPFGIATGAALLILVLSCPGLTLAADDPGHESLRPRPEVGARVALKEPGTPLRDGDRKLSNRGETIFRVERTEGDYADVASEQGGVRGWVETDEVVPIELARDVYTRKLETDPGDARVYLARGRIAIEKKDLETAIADFTAAIRLDPRLALAYRERGLAWDRRRYFDRALEDLNEAIRIEPGNIDLVMARGKMCSTRGRHHQAMADFEYVIRMRPGDPAAHVARAEELIEDLEADRAIAELNRAIELDPTYVKALLARGRAAKRKFDYGSAIADYAEAARRAPGNAETHQALAWMLGTCQKREYRDGARGVQEGMRACELSGWKSPECLNALAAACAEAGDYDSAVKWQSKAVELLPTDDRTRPLYRRRLFMYEVKHPYRD
jgi:tetratricopeptide (TPR) repeat protein